MSSISRHFSEHEVSASQLATRQGVDNTPAPEHLENARILAVNVLDVVRDYFRVPITPSSWYRCPWLNKAVGGAKQSQHLTGEAVDFVVPGVPNGEVYDYIKDNCNFDQLIWEYPEGPTDGGWIHLSYKAVTSENRRNSKIFIKGKA